jgi:pyruvate dehydrogenase E2 component (dihydrolipoamide acetyltransferase)
MKATNRIPISPRARRALRQRGLDPAALRGSGPGGRVVEADVLGAAAPPALAVPRIPAGGNLSSMRRAVAAKVSESFATVPHFYLRSQADVTTLVALRQSIAETIEKQCGTRPSVTDFVLRAMALGLRDHPQANRVWQNGSIVSLPSVDVGLVVQVEDGLLVPILHDADRLGLAEMVRQRASLTAVVRSGKIPADVLGGGATSLSNLGKHRVDEFTPIIQPPQSSMLAIGRVAERPAAVEGRLCLRQTVHLTLSVDHRVMDGVPAAEFFDRIVELLENPFLLLYETQSS